MADNSYTDIMEKNHMEIPWHDYARQDGNILIDKAGLIEKASVIGRVGLIMLSCGTGAWRVRTSMNRLSKELGVTCTVDVGLMSIEFNCFDGNDCISQSLSIANTGVNTSKLYRMEQFVDNFPNEEAHLTGEEIHRRLDEIEQIHAIYSPARLGLAAAIACCAFTFLLGGGPIEMILAFVAAGIGNLIRTKLIKHHFTLFLNIAVSISASCFIYAAFLKIAEMAFNVPSIHEAGYICSMLFIIPGFPFITSGIDLAKLDLRSGLERLAYAIIIVMVATMFAWIMALLLDRRTWKFIPSSFDHIAGFGTLPSQVAGFHRAVPSTTLDKAVQLYPDYTKPAGKVKRKVFIPAAFPVYPAPNAPILHTEQNVYICRVDFSARRRYDET